MWHCGTFVFLFSLYSLQISTRADEIPSSDVTVVFTHNLAELVLHCAANDTNNDSSSVIDYVWKTPWAHRNGSFLPNLTTTASSAFPSNWSFSGPPYSYVTQMQLHANGTLIISPFRGFFLGQWVCYDSKLFPNGSALKTFKVETQPYVIDMYILSLIIGFSCLGGSLLTGIVVGSIRYAYENWCGRQKKKPPTALIGVIPVPMEEDEEEAEGHMITESTPLKEQLKAAAAAAGGGGNNAAIDMVEGSYSPPTMSAATSSLSKSSSSLNADIDLVFTDENVAAEYQTVLNGLADAQSDPMQFSERMEDLRSRLRRDVGHRVKIMRTKMRSFRDESANRMSQAVQSIGSTSAMAAQKMRNGLASSVDAMKGQMRSVAELCGSVHVGQTISIVSITMQHDGEKKETLIKNYVFQ